jgi:hypothetical protein
VTVAALYVETNGVYYGLPDVDPWDEERDARLYEGPWPVVAHPPCKHWSLMGQCRGYSPRLEDVKTFTAALHAVGRFGGVLEQPAHSKAWEKFMLPIPTREGWNDDLFSSGVTCEVDQAWYGHPTNKRTWLYYVGPNPPELQWGRAPFTGRTVRNDGGGGRDQRSRTPPAFRDVLLDMARSASPALHRLDGCA